LLVLYEYYSNHPKVHTKISLTTSFVKYIYIFYTIWQALFYNKCNHRLFKFIIYLFYLEIDWPKFQTNKISSKFKRIIPIVKVNFNTDLFNLNYMYIYNVVKQYLWPHFLRILMCFHLWKHRSMDMFNKYM